MAYLGGVMLSVLILLTCLSIVGRELNGLCHAMISAGVLPGVGQLLLDLGVGPVNGDFELIEAGIAFSIFAFLPLCQITGGHASVDVFTARLSRRANRILRMLAELAFAFVLVMIAVQLYHGMQSKISSGQTTFLIQFPVWWAYALSLVGAVVAAIVGVYVALARVGEALSDTDIIPQESGAEH
jgi:fumarate reductase subunit D